MRSFFASLGRLGGLIVASAAGFAAMGALVILVPVVLGLGFVAAVGLIGAMFNFGGWMILGEVSALKSAGLMGLIGFVAFTVMVTLFDLVASVWKRLTAPPSPTPLRISLA